MNKSYHKSRDADYDSAVDKLEGTDRKKAVSRNGKIVLPAQSLRPRKEV